MPDPPTAAVNHEQSLRRHDNTVTIVIVSLLYCLNCKTFLEKGYDAIGQRGFSKVWFLPVVTGQEQSHLYHFSLNMCKV